MTSDDRKKESQLLQADKWLNKAIDPSTEDKPDEDKDEEEKEEKKDERD